MNESSVLHCDDPFRCDVHDTYTNQTSTPRHHHHGHWREIPFISSDVSSRFILRFICIEHPSRACIVMLPMSPTHAR